MIVLEANDPYVSLVEEGTIFAGTAFVPGRFLVDIFTWRMPDGEYLH